jgi:hypothetical protein
MGQGAHTSAGPFLGRLAIEYALKYQKSLKSLICQYLRDMPHLIGGGSPPRGWGRDGCHDATA